MTVSRLEGGIYFHVVSNILLPPPYLLRKVDTGEAFKELCVYAREHDNQNEPTLDAVRSLEGRHFPAR